MKIRGGESIWLFAMESETAWRRVVNVSRSGGRRYDAEGVKCNRYSASAIYDGAGNRCISEENGTVANEENSIRNEGGVGFAMCGCGWLWPLMKGGSSYVAVWLCGHAVSCHGSSLMQLRNEGTSAKAMVSLKAAWQWRISWLFNNGSYVAVATAAGVAALVRIRPVCEERSLSCAAKYLWLGSGSWRGWRLAKI